ncbi:MAG: hypothetical protein K6A78_01390 [Prevotella sp.]|nr:hypothetical protein [Prevotella sp.]
MKIHKIILLLLIVTSLLFGCREKDQSNKGFATEFVDFNKEYVMSNCKIICRTNKKTPISFDKKKTFFKISDDMFKKSHNIVDSLFERERRVNPPARPYPIEHYFLQYVGYSEGGRKYVYVNLSTFMRLRTVQPGLVLMPSMGSCVYLDKEDGYAGYIIIDIKNGQVVKYKFEENETTPILPEYDYY